MTMSGCIGGVDKTLAQLRRSMYFALQAYRVWRDRSTQGPSRNHSFRGKPRRDAECRGYGSATLAATGALTMLAATSQAYWVKDPLREIPVYPAIWVATAAASLAVISLAAVNRARHVRSGLAMEMMFCALGQFLPAIVAGLMLIVVLVRTALQSVWMLPGLWQVLFSMGVFASCRFLPRPMFGHSIWHWPGAVAVVLEVGHREMYGDRNKKSQPSHPFAYNGLDRLIHERARLGVLTSLMPHPKGCCSEISSNCAG